MWENAHAFQPTRVMTLELKVFQNWPCPTSLGSSRTEESFSLFLWDLSFHQAPVSCIILMLAKDKNFALCDLTISLRRTNQSKGALVLCPML